MAAAAYGAHTHRWRKQTRREKVSGWVRLKNKTILTKMAKLMMKSASLVKQPILVVSPGDPRTKPVRGLRVYKSRERESHTHTHGRLKVNWCAVKEGRRRHGEGVAAGSGAAAEVPATYFTSSSLLYQLL